MQTLKLTKKYEKYSEYKDSGVPWLGKVSSSWDISKFKANFNLSDDRVSDYPKIETLLSVSGYRGIETKNIDSLDGQMPSEDVSDYRIVRIGQLVVNTMWLNYTGLGVSKYEGYVSPAYRAYTISEKMSPEFVHYLMRSLLYVQKYSSLLYGIRPNSLQVKPYDFEKIEILIPKKEEQIKIASFLDEKTTFIDQTIEKKQKLIELLREKRTAVINHAVTKGLDSKVELVESGIDWIGKIPIGWEVDKVNHRTLANNGGVWGDDDITETGEIVLRSTEINQDGSWDLSNAIKRKLTKDEFKKAQLFTDDLLITKSSGSSDHLGKTAIVSKEIEDLRCAYSNFMQRLRLNNTFLPKYFFYLINNKIGRDQINYWGSTTSGLVNLNATLIGRFLFPIPPTIEQERICHYLDERLQRHDMTAKFVEQSIEILQEFKSSLISNVVTGKVKINS